MVRKRRSAAQAKREILNIAEQLVRETGPDKLRLDAVAKHMGVSRQAVLHHFHSREDLMRAVVEQAYKTLLDDLVSAFRPPRSDAATEAKSVDADDTARMLGKLDEVAREKGYARLGAWLLLSDEGLSPTFFAEAGKPLVNKLVPDDKSRDAQFRLLLMAAAVFGDALFGTRLRDTLGLEDSPSERSAFLAWLADNLT